MAGDRVRLLVVADASDRGARAVAELVAARHGEQAVRTVAPATLTTLATWRHRIVAGRAATSLQLPAGTCLADPPAAVVLNRMRWVITPTMTSEADRQYAVMELHALLLSWLAGLDAAVVNPPTPSNLAGVGLSEFDLLAHLARRGLPVRTVELTTQQRALPPALRIDADPPYRRSPPAARQARVLVAGRTVLGASVDAEGLCRRVADVLGCPLLELDLAREEPRGWVVAGVDPLPPLRVPAEVEAVAAMIDRLAATSPGTSPPPPRSPSVPPRSPSVRPQLAAVSSSSPLPPSPPPPPMAAAGSLPPRPVPANLPPWPAALSGSTPATLPPLSAPPAAPPPLAPVPAAASASPVVPSSVAAEPAARRPTVWSSRRAPKRRRAT